MIKTYFYNHEDGKTYHDVDLANKDSFLQQENDLLWVDLFQFTEQEIKQVARIFDFHPLAVEDCLHYSPRAKLDKYEDYYLLLVHALRYDEESDDEIELVQLDIFLGRNFVVTVHKQSLPVLGRIAKMSLQSPQFLNKGMEYFLYSIIDGNTDEIFPILDRINVRIDELEDEIYNQSSSAIAEEVLVLKKTILTIRRAVMPQKRVFTSINAGGHVRFAIREDFKPYFLDLVDHMERITDSIDQFRDLVETAQSTYYSLISARTNESIRILTVFSTVFMPLTFFTGFFGMNVPLPYQNSGLATIAITLVLVGMSAAVLLIFKRLKLF
jgi:magnesium transporter